MELNRRSFLVGCCSAAAAALGSGSIRGLAFAADRGAGDGPDILVNIFLRGAIDSLSLIVPYGDANYEPNRPSLRILPPGQTNGALQLNGFFGLHPRATHLQQLYQSQALALVVAAGSPDPTRSHFDAMASMERGTPGSKSVSTGWIGRHLLSAGAIEGEVPVLVASSDVPDSLFGFDNVATITDIGSFEYNGRWDQEDAQRLALRQMYNGSHWIQQAGAGALDFIDRIAAANPGDYVPEFGAVYPENSWGNSLQTVAQMVKLNLGLRVASLDLGGWDTHENQGGDGQGFFATQAATLSQGLHALYTDLTNFASRVTIVVMSEFGRRVRENGSDGTDHGHGSAMLVLGGNVNGGQIYGQWPGLATEQLDEGKDLAVVVDYRRVLSEILVRRLQNPNLPTIFPRGPEYDPLGIVRGADLPITTTVPAASPGLMLGGVAAGMGLALAARGRRISEVEAQEAQG